MDDALAPRPGIQLTEDQRLDWLRLIRSENVGPATFIDLINHFGSASAALEGLPELSARGRGGKAIKVCSRDEAERELEKLGELKGRVVCLGEQDYPTALRAADAPPPVLSVLGSADCLNQPAVAFVGSRNASLSGIKLTRSLAAAVGQAGYCIISGLARGIDAAAHEASLETGTIAVFAGGVDHIYPHENRQLARDIYANGGALVSEMPIGWKPRAQDFPRRNRIVAGLSLGLVVVEAAKRSGSLISARLANENGRQVFAVPGSPLDPRSEGANHLIREGATLITSADDVIEALTGMNPLYEQEAYSLRENDPLDPGEDIVPDQSDRDRVLTALDFTPVTVDDLIHHTGLTPSAMQMILLELDLSGQLERHPGNRVSRLQ